jgi:hypothetical protein
MKRTDQERIERELRRREKKEKIAASRGDREFGDEDVSPGTYIKNLVDLFQHDDVQIYNTTDDDEVMELLLSMKEELPEKDWDKVLRSAIRKTKVQEKELAFTELKSVLADC